MATIFFSYRRRAARGITGRIYDRLVSRYGKESVFIDRDNIAPGLDFRRKINEVLNRCNVLVAIVGPGWLDGSVAGGGLQLENDWVRIEIEAGLKRDIRIIPALVEGTSMPSPAALPESLRDFAFRQAVIISDDQDFDVHVARLIRAIDDAVAAPAADAGADLAAIHGGADRTGSAAPAQVGISAALEVGHLPGPRLENETIPPLLTASAEIKPELPTAEVATEFPAEPMRTPSPEAADTSTDVSGGDRGPWWTRGRVAVLMFCAAALVGVAALLSYTPMRTWRSASADSGPSVQQSQAAVGVDQPAVHTTAATGPAKAVIKPVSAGCLATALGTPVEQSSDMGGPLVPVHLKPSLVTAAKVRAIVVAPKGEVVATAGDDGWVRLWDAKSFKLTRVLPGSDRPIYGLDFSSDGRFLASASWDGTVKLWDLAGDDAAQVYEGIDSRSNSVKLYGISVLAGDPFKYFATASEDGLVRIWDRQKKQPAAVRQDHAGDQEHLVVRSVSYAPNGSGEFVTAGFDGRIRFYRLDRSVEARDANKRLTLHVAYSPDSRRVLSVGSDSAQPDPGAAPAKLWDVRAGGYKVIRGLKHYAVSGAWSPDGKRVAIGGGGRDRSIIIWDVDDDQLIATLSGHDDDVEALAFLGNDRLISAGEDKTIKVWSLTARKEILTAIGYGASGYLVYTPDACYFGSSGIEDKVNLTDGTATISLTDSIRRRLFVAEGFGVLLSR